MNKAAKEEVEKRLRAEQYTIRGKLRQNKWAMQKLVEEQTKLKRELPILEELIKSLNLK